MADEHDAQPQDERASADTARETDRHAEDEVAQAFRERARRARERAYDAGDENAPDRAAETVHSTPGLGGIPGG